ncbi:MAG: UDP-N-acetylmuramate--L-alanine ligase [Proteobacteria bacterium]|nr:MAG: UDP-N-acetylmuramate--L-alanine ligase [Pseudomonadota bacterium]PIE18072.1 MAG: UDP-N-acetylmuramate--L-alanine ligase [Pseudomonadota bacterium]
MRMFKGRVKRIHFVGIGGIGMSGIAEVLLNLGFEVSGSDLRQSDTTQRLSDLGGRVACGGHAPENIEGADVVVISSAVKGDNPEVMKARRLATPVIPRAEMLAELMRMKYGVAIAGSHGKTTTTSLISAICDEAKIDPTVVIGGKVNALGSNARLGQGEYLVAEADESDGSFLSLSPTIAVVTNIDPEHMDHYGDLDRLKETFVTFVNKIPFYGLAVLCLDSPNVQSVLPQVDRRFVTYGTTSQADYSLKDIKPQGLATRFTPVRHGEACEPITLNMVGQHNVLNALAAVAVAEELDIDYAVIRRALDGFNGVQRRFTIRGEENGIMVVDDYGHHPTEIRATLSGARAAAHGMGIDGADRRVIAVFQPHRYTRVRDQFEGFATCFYDADVVLMTEVYPAGEEPIEGIDGEHLAAAIREHGHRDVTLFPDHDAVLTTLRERCEPGDLVVTLGAGNVWQIGQRLLDALRS